MTYEEHYYQMLEKFPPLSKSEHKDAIYYEAYKRGHSYGFREVQSELEDLLSFLTYIGYFKEN